MTEEKKKFKGSLSLDWINKDKSLYYELDESEGKGIKPVWVDKEDIKVSEPRILNFISSYGDEKSENLLIRGDNLLVLRTLVEQFKNKEEKDKVKCIYIDPPYNTGNAFEKYDDNLKHSEWLTMMRDRLLLLRKLLRKDGVIFVSIDDEHLYHLGVLLSEIFPRKIDRGMIIWNNAGSTKGYRNIVKNHDYILARTIKEDNNNLNYFIENYPEKSDEISDRLYIKVQDKNPIGEVIFKKGTRIEGQEDITFKNEVGDKIKLKIISGKMVFEKGKLKSDVTLKFACPYMKQIPLYYKNKEEGKPTLDSKGQEILEVYFNSSGLPWYRKKRGFSILDSVLKDVPNSSAREQEILFGKDTFEYAKPEELIRRLLEYFTKPGDLVLDCFLGSGTTAAISHKLKRKWIGIEMGKHAETHCIPRMIKVLDGKDGLDTTKELNWKGGSGFKYYRLGGSLISGKDINWNLTYEQIAEALFYAKNFKLVDNKELHKKKIFLGENRNEKGVFAICNISKDLEFIKSDEYFEIINMLKELSGFKELNIYTNKAVNVRKDDQLENVFIRKIPQTILRRYKLL